MIIALVAGFAVVSLARNVKENQPVAGQIERVVTPKAPPASSAVESSVIIADESVETSVTIE